MFLKILKSFLIIVIFTTLTALSIMAEQPDFDLNSKSAILMEYETGEIIFEKNPHMKLAPASMTKIMTMLLAVEAIEQGRVGLTDKLVVSELAASMGGSQIWLEPGEEMTLEEMLRAIAIVSANDACVAVAEYLYGTEEAFVKRMNERARELGLKNSYYYNTNGLPTDNEEIQGNYTTAYDLAVLTREILKYPQVLKWTSTWIDYLRDGSSVLNNTNRLVRHYLGADGLKTGYTEEAKYCLTSTARRDGIRFIAVVMAAVDSKTRFTEAAELLSFGFSTYQGYEVAAKDEFITEVKIPNGKEDTARAIIKEELIVPVKKGNENSIKKELILNEVIKAPLNKGDKIGELRAYKGNLLLKSSDIILDRDVEKAGIFQLVLRIITRIIQLIINLF